MLNLCVSMFWNLFSVQHELWYIPEICVLFCFSYFDETLTDTNFGSLFHIMSYVHHLKPGQEFKTGTWRPELKPKLQRTAVHWFNSLDLPPVAYLAICPLHGRPACPGMRLPTFDLGPAHQLAVKKLPLRHAHRAVWWRQFLKWGSFFLLCQADN